MSGTWDLDDFRKQLQTVKTMKPLVKLMAMVPGMRGVLEGTSLTGDQLQPIEAILGSMTLQERQRPELLSGRSGWARRRRIARGSGTSVQDVNALVKQFKAMKRMIADMRPWGGGGSDR